LARAVYGLPKLVVLDEPNSSLDEAGDRALVEALKTLKENGTTVVVISHRSSVLPAVDRLLALQDGLVVAFGPRDEVRRKLQEAQQGAPRTSHVVALRPPGGPESGS
jgi:ABC-type protease/lipase transport system fused ATPase/permease subunit